MNKRLGLGIVLCCLALATSLYEVQAQSSVTVVEHRETVIFGDSIRFWARLESDAPIERVEVFYRSKGALQTLRGEAVFEQSEASFVHYVRSNPGEIPVFSTVEYRYRITFQNGDSIVTDTFEFKYLDNRFQWQMLSDPPFQAFWVEGDAAFGQAVLDAARAGLRRAQTLIAVEEPQSLEIYVYPSASLLQEALELSGLVLAAGHASPELGVMMVSLPRGATQDLEIQRQIPHELMHILLYEKWGARYDNVPTWLDEGLASLNELYPNPDYYLLLQSAVNNEALLPIESLCRGFRLEASLFYLSYAQSESFTRFLYDNYGSSGLEALLEKYADGVECTRGPELAFGQSLNRLEERWVRSLMGQVNLVQALKPFLPWLIVLVALFGAPILLTISGLRRVKAVAPKQKPA